MSDTKAAAERVRKFFPDKNLEVYASLANTEDGAYSCHLADLHTLACDYIADHLPDDDEPITDNWWMTLSDNKHGFLWSSHGFWLSWINSQCFFDNSIDSIALPTVTTRGQLRTLARVLGIKLKENGQ